jgi:hypothetical protein
MNSFVSCHTQQIALNRAAAGCKKTMTNEKKDATTHELPVGIKNPQNALVENMLLFEFARIYYDGP